VLIALGGGAVGNLAGLAAGLLYRGVRFVQVPTTVTAQTDSTLSNKQGINGARGKNQFGMYHAPLFIWGDAAYPRHEPVRQQKSGIVEGIKNVLISRDSVEPAEQMLEMWRRDGCSAELLKWLIDSKLPIIRRDPTERGYAMVLEYGHTFGHAIEWLAGGRLLHGEAVSIGMCLAAEVSGALGLMPEALRRDHYRLLGEMLGTPTKLPDSVEPEVVYETMLGDNKRTGKGLRFLLLEKCGRVFNPQGDYMAAVEREVVMAQLRKS
jgi:3-dehydroquinate synthetase